MYFGTFIAALFNHWGALMTGGIIIAGIGLVEHWRGSPLPWVLSKWLAIIFVLIAAFLAWNDEHKTVVALTDRDEIKEQLRKFYAEGERLAQGPSSKDINVFNEYERQVKQWQEAVCDWLDKNMATSACYKFKDYKSHLPTFSTYQNADPQETWDRNYLHALCVNLDEMIKSNAWDKISLK
jgi:hypothetical protein